MFETGEAAAAGSKLQDEAGRLLALRRYAVVDTPAERNFELITGLVRDLLQVPICAISLVEETQQWFKSITGSDLTGTPRSEAFCDHTIRSYSCMTVPDARQDERFSMNPLVVQAPFIRSYAGVPLTTPDGYNLGALCVIDGQPRRFSEEEQGLLARFAALVVEQLELRTLATQDALTSALSRRAFVEAATGALRQFERDGRPLAIISFDIDHFKTVNDRWGHAAGDRVLTSVVAACRKQMRPRDVLGRLGGEEFAVLLNDATAEMARHCAERLRKAVSDLNAEPSGRVTASFGVAPLSPGFSLETWLEQADSALYQAKRTGRNRCVVAQPALRAVA